RVLSGEEGMALREEVRAWPFEQVAQQFSLSPAAGHKLHVVWRCRVKSPAGETELQLTADPANSCRVRRCSPCLPNDLRAGSGASGHRSGVATFHHGSF